MRVILNHGPLWMQCIVSVSKTTIEKEIEYWKRLTDHLVVDDLARNLGLVFLCLVVGCNFVAIGHHLVCTKYYDVVDGAACCCIFLDSYWLYLVSVFRSSCWSICLVMIVKIS